MTPDEEVMSRCLDLARTALGKGDSPVGSLIVKDGRVIAQGIEAVKAKSSDSTAHAEVIMTTSVPAATAGNITRATGTRIFLPFARENSCFGGRIIAQSDCCDRAPEQAPLAEGTQQ